jgi:hypothetical protein
MQQYSGSSNQSSTVFFTAPPGDASVYQVHLQLTMTGTGDDTQVRVFKNVSTEISHVGGEQGDYITDTVHVLLSADDELSFTVVVDGTFSWVLQLRLVKVLDELAPLE